MAREKASGLFRDYTLSIPLMLTDPVLSTWFVEPKLYPLIIDD